MNYQPSEIVTQMNREELQKQQVDPRSPDLKKQQENLKSPENLRKSIKIKSIVEVLPEQNLPSTEANQIFNQLNFDSQQKPQLQKSIVVLKQQIDKKMFDNPIQIKIIEKAEDVIKALVYFDESIGSLVQDSFHFKLKQQNLSERLSEISIELEGLYSKAKSQKLAKMDELNQIIQNMLKGEIYSKYCQNILQAFAAQNFRYECSRYLAVEFL